MINSDVQIIFGETMTKDFYLLSVTRVEKLQEATKFSLGLQRKIYGLAFNISKLPREIFKD